MKNAFKEIPEAIRNTRSIAERCNVKFTLGANLLPVYELEKGQKPYALLEKLAFEGMHHKLGPDPGTPYKERLRRELDIIQKMRYSSYFLIVWDFISYAKKKGIPVGPGRGSAAGSLVSYCLSITDIDPLKYNLLFERFLNPERISMPDIDIDFCIEGRDKVINYVRDKYGHDKVCHIITFGTMMAKGVIKDVARALSFSFEDSNAITNLIPEQLKITLKEAIEQEPLLQELIKNNPKVKHLFDIAFKLEGLTRHASKHTCGIV